MFKVARSWLGRSKASESSIGETSSQQGPTLESRIAKLNTVKPVSPPSQEKSIETRAAERFVPRRTDTYLTASNGKKFSARILNISILGVAIDADFSQVSPESIIMVGARRVQKGRRIMLGMVFLFERPLDPNTCGPDLIL